MQTLIHSDALTLADLLRAEWPAARERIRLSGHPTCEGDEGDGDGKPAAEGDGDGKPAGEGKPTGGDEGDGDGDGEVKPPAGTEDLAHWKKMARQHERAVKKERADREALAAKLKEREDADKSEQEKAIEAARAEGENTALTKYEATRRDDRLEMAVVKLTGKELKIGEGDKAEMVKFADSDDAQLRLERAIRKGDLSYDDVYADGKVKSDALTEFLIDLLAENPHLRARSASGEGNGKVVDMDGGKGSAAKGPESMSVEDHVKAQDIRAA